MDINLDKEKNILEMIAESVLIKMKCNGPQAIRVSLTHCLVPCSVCFRALTSTHKKKIFTQLITHIIINTTIIIIIYLETSQLKCKEWIT